MNYIALLRGINVGGKSLIKMSDLKTIFEKSGFKNVRTYINSGNVIFESNDKNFRGVEKLIETKISKELDVNTTIVILSQNDLIKIIENIPNEWETRDDIRKYVAFTIDCDPKDVVKTIKLRKGVDSVKEGAGTVYMTTLMSGLTKSGFSKMAGSPIYKFITIRNFNTVQKINTLMNSGA